MYWIVTFCQLQNNNNEFHKLPSLPHFLHKHIILINDPTFRGQLWSAVPGDCTYTSYGDELKLQRVAGCGEAAGIFLENGHPQGHRDGLQTKIVVESPAGVAGVATGLMDHLWHPVQVDVLPGEAWGEQGK